MCYVIEEQWGIFVFAYLDDIIVYARDWEEHLVHISLVLERLDIYGLTVSPTKCHFGYTSLPYLGHWISADGNSAQPEHIEAIRTATFPGTRREMQSFIGTCNWVKEYNPNSSHVLVPLTDLLSPKRPYKISPEKLHAFEAVKVAFTNP